MNYFCYYCTNLKNVNSSNILIIPTTTLQITVDIFKKKKKPHTKNKTIPHTTSHYYSIFDTSMVHLK